MIDAKDLADAVGAALAGTPHKGVVQFAPDAVLGTWGDVAEVRTVIDTGVGAFAEPFACAGGPLHQWLKSRSGEVELVVEDGVLVATCGRARFECRAAIDEVQVGWVDPSGMLDAGVTVAELARVRFAASADTVRPILCAVMVGGRGIMATDSFRAAYIERPDVDRPAMLIPASAIAVASKWAGDDAAVLSDGDAVEFRTEDRTIRCRLVEGDAPDAWGLLDDAAKAACVTVDVPTGPLIDALKAAARLDGVARLTAEGGTLRVEAHDADGTQVLDVIDHVVLDGAVELHWGMNPTFFGDAIEATGSERATLHMVDHLRPIVIRTEGLDQLVMPVRIS